MNSLNPAGLQAPRATVARQVRRRAPFVAQLALAACGLAAAAPATAQGRSDSLSLPTATVVGARQGPGAAQAELAEIDTAPVAETPLALRWIGARELARDGIGTMSAAARGDASVGDAYNAVGYVETLQIRGFVLDDLLNYRRNGLPASAHAPAAFENVERLEILKGISGILSGSSTPGGLVNTVTRRPPEAGRLGELGATLSERGSLRLHADAGGRFGAGNRLGWRVNLAGEQRRPAPRDARAERFLAALAFDHRRDDGARLDVELQVHRVRQISVPGFGLLDTDGDGRGETAPPPGEPAFDPRVNLNRQPWSTPFRSREWVGSIRWEQPVGGGWLWALRTGAQRIVTDDAIAFPDGCSSAPVYVYPGLCGNGDVDLYDYRSPDERRRVWAADTWVEGSLRTATVVHGLRFGLRRIDASERLPPRQTYNYAGTINVFAPVPVAAAPDAATPNTDRDLRSTEAYVYDAMRLSSRWSAWAGLRATRLQRESRRSDGLERVALAQDLLTPWAAVGLRPRPGALLYLSAGSGIEVESVPDQPLAFANHGAALPARRSRQLEVGFKRTLARGGLATLAVFSIERPLSEDLPLAGGLSERISGTRRVRHRGVEVEVEARLSASTRIEASTAWIDARTIQARDPALVGRATPNVPRVAGSAALSHAPAALPGLTITARVTGAGGRAADLDPRARIGGHAQFDLAAVWDGAGGGGRTTWRAGIDNLFDRRYWREAPTQSWGGVYLFPAAPRTARIGLSVALD